LSTNVRLFLGPGERTEASVELDHIAGDEWLLASLGIEAVDVGLGVPKVAFVGPS